MIIAVGQAYEQKYRRNPPDRYDKPSRFSPDGIQHHPRLIEKYVSPYFSPESW
jgi:hypothetical protein